MSYPCGKCWNCIHAFRESWRIRLYETMLAQKVGQYKGFIYDTFTLSPSAMPSISAGDYQTGEAVFGIDALHDPECMKVIDHYEGRVPFLAKETVSRFLKIGRELYKFHEGERCNCKWFAALEYGPLWSRPHVHICVFGVNRRQWVKYWAKRWRQTMGFTKTKWIDLVSAGYHAQDHCSRISMYLSKYLLKGCYESPLIKYGILPKAWRIISHGIGEEYLEYDFQHRFDWLKKDVKFHMANRLSLESSNRTPYTEACREFVSKISALLPTELQSLKTYSKDGYNYSLPRYYSDKLLGVHRKGLAGRAVKAIIQKDAFDSTFEEVLQHSANCNYFPKLGRDVERYRKAFDDDSRLFNFAYFQYVAFKRVEAVRKAEWHRVSSLNQYRRLRAKPQTGDLGLLL